MSNWLVAVTIDSPAAASHPYNYGWQSFTPRGLGAFTTDGLPATSAYYSNMSVFAVTSISANTPSGFNLLPFAYGSQELPSSLTFTPMIMGLHLLALVVSFVMVKKLMYTHSVVSLHPPDCKEGCPAMDGGFSDNGPISPALAYASALPPTDQPRSFTISGASQQFITLKYLMGRGPLGMTSMMSVNVCPFTQTSICTMLGNIRELILSVTPVDTANQYYEIAQVFSVYKPEAQVLATFCGDPLLLDNFMGECTAKGVCSMYLVAVPSNYANIAFSVSSYVFVLTQVFLAATPVAARFVNHFIPEKMRMLNYYRNMDDWFPDFSATALQKGGVGFTKPAGHSLMDFLTYLVQRLALRLLMSKTASGGLVKGMMPTCGYTVYKQIESAIER